MAHERERGAKPPARPLSIRTPVPSWSGWRSESRTRTENSGNSSKDEPRCYGAKVGCRSIGVPRCIDSGPFRSARRPPQQAAREAFGPSAALHSLDSSFSPLRGASSFHWAATSRAVSGPSLDREPIRRAISFDPGRSLSATALARRAIWGQGPPADSCRGR